MSATIQEETKKGQKQKIPLYQDVDGFRIPSFFPVETFKSALTYKPRLDDLFIVTYPKCGTTWVQNIIACIFKDGKPFQSALEIYRDTAFLEMAGAAGAETMKRPGSLKTHLPFHLAPWSSSAKYIFIARNPKDCCVSFYHHTENTPAYRFKDGTFDDFFELFINGEVDYGDYFDTLISWYEHRHDPNVLFITYEQLQKDVRTYVLKIAEFIGSQYKEKLERDEKIFDDVIHYSSFSFMKVHLNKLYIELGAMPKELIINNPHIPAGIKRTLLSGGYEFTKKNLKEVNIIRKGIIGDWKNYFSPTQNARLEKKFRERTIGTDLGDLWKDDMNRVLVKNSNHLTEDEIRAILHDTCDELQQEEAGLRLKEKHLIDPPCSAGQQ
ncbi:sulfotransferase 1C2 [Nephila pilipes]|uniref:Sulfotransferase 1C2 n=1 Tax=Nephila pilipes TaxID=299642 RepID=A0A8X6U8H4_NEPPI|nr:sulfotransferase 1C2 [Nephila pilipes]